MAKHLIVVSIDALVFEDLEYARTLPNFSKILKSSSIIERVKTIYPSLTHPVHATLITGANAGTTGVINNIIFDPIAPATNNSHWYNDIDQVKCDTILHAAKRAGLTTATSSWPMTSGGQEVIDYLIPNALNECFEGFDDPIDAYRALGAQESVVDIIKEAVNRFGYQDRHPEVDQFQIYCACEIIKRYKPNLLLTHPSYVDNQRHVGGVFSERVNNALRMTDTWLGMILDALDQAGIGNETDIVLLSDHGQINITRVISPNVYLADAGYIKLDNEGNLISYDAFAKSAGASAHVYLSNKNDKALYDGVYKLLTDMANEGIYGFEKVYTLGQVNAAHGLDGAFSFVLETDGYTSFGEHLTRPSVRGFDISDYRFGRATHGHEPTKGPQPTFIASGPSFKSGISIPNGDILNHAPTLAAALGIDFKAAQGSAVKEILN